MITRHPSDLRPNITFLFLTKVWPCVFSENITLESYVKFFPVRSICCPPSTEHRSRFCVFTKGISWAECWAEKKKKKIKFKVFIIQLSNSNTQNRRSLQEVMFRGYRQHTIEQNAEYRRRQDELMNSSCLFILLHPHLWCLASLHTLKPWKAQPSCLYHIYFYPDTLLQKVLGLRDSILCPAMYWYDIKKETKKETNKQTTK